MSNLPCNIYRYRHCILNPFQPNRLFAHVYDTDTNFILIRLNDKRAKEIKVELLREGNILIRDASNFIGLDDRYIRIAIKSHKENELLIRHMKKLLGD